MNRAQNLLGWSGGSDLENVKAELEKCLKSKVPKNLGKWSTDEEKQQPKKENQDQREESDNWRVLIPEKPETWSISQLDHHDFQKNEQLLKIIYWSSGENEFGSDSGGMLNRLRHWKGDSNTEQNFMKVPLHLQQWSSKQIGNLAHRKSGIFNRLKTWDGKANPNNWSDWNLKIPKELCHWDARDIGALAYRNQGMMRNLKNWNDEESSEDSWENCSSGIFVKVKRFDVKVETNRKSSTWKFEFYEKMEEWNIEVLKEEPHDVPLPENAVVNDYSTEPLPFTVTVTLERIENIDTCKTKEIMVKMEYAGVTLTQSDRITIDSKVTDVQLTGFIQTAKVTPEFMNTMLTNPILFTIYDYSMPPPNQSVPPLKLDKDTKTKTVKSTATGTAASGVLSSAQVLGICNLSLEGFIKGKKRIQETLLVHAEKKLTGKDAIPWIKLPRVLAFARISDENMFANLNERNNIIAITVESVYNIPSSISAGGIFDAIIPMPNFGDKTTNLVFGNGLVTPTKDVYTKKKWYNLQLVEGLGGRTNHEICDEFHDVISSLPIDFNWEMEARRQQNLIEWNTWKSNLISDVDSSYIHSKLMKYRVWPIEIISTKAGDKKGIKVDKKSKPAASEGSSNSDRFLAFLNLNPLLYPGVKKVRVAAPLYTYSQYDLSNKFGAEFAVSASQTTTTSLKIKTASEKSKTSAKEVEERKEETSGVPVVSSEGTPSFVVVEVELWKPFTKPKDPEFLESELKSYVCLKGAISKKKLDYNRARESFITGIQNLVFVIAKEYEDFVQSQDISKIDPENFESVFAEFLRHRENFSRVTNCLGERITLLIKEKYGGLKQYNERIPDIYVDLVEEMHKITNNWIFGVTGRPHRHYDSGNAQLFAEEAIEEEDFEQAKKCLLQNLARYKTHPDYWLDYAVYCIRINDYDTATEAIREALNLNIYSQMGLLLYALVMSKLNEATISEITFQFLLTKYPNFIEGWKIFQLFYVVYQNSEGRDIALTMSKTLEHERREHEDWIKRMEEGVDESLEKETEEFRCPHFPSPDSYVPAREGHHGIITFDKGMSWSEPLSWSTTLCPKDNLNIRTVIILLRLGFYEFASMALSDDLVLKGNIKDPYYRYYIAVGYYLQGLYNEAISVLEEVIQEYGKDYSLWSLMGHCFYKLEDHANAIACYEYVIESFNRPDNIHIIYLRMGNYYLHTEKFSCAKQIFATGCKYSPSPRLWKGVGRACLRLEEYEEAETAFSEANYLDNEDAETWGYLALTNGLLGRLNMFSDCFLEAKKKKLSNESLIEEIEQCINLNYIEPEDFF